MSSDRPTCADTADVQAVVGRALESYVDITGRFDAIGGLDRVFALFEQMRVELERVQLRRLNNLKVAFGGGTRDGG